MDHIENRYERASKRVKKKKAFYGHLSSYLSVGVFFFVLNITTSPGHWWFIYPMLGWGIGLASHYFSVFGFPGVGVLDEEWEEKEIARELNKSPRSRYHDKDTERPLDLKPLERREKHPRWNDDEFV